MVRLTRTAKLDGAIAKMDYPMLASAYKVHLDHPGLINNPSKSAILIFMVYKKAVDKEPDFSTLLLSQDKITEYLIEAMTGIIPNVVIEATVATQMVLINAK